MYNIRSDCFFWDSCEKVSSCQAWFLSRDENSGPNPALILIGGKSLYHPLTYGGGLHNPQPMKRSISPPELSKTGQITPKAVLKNHSKSQKNHKMKNLIVLDSKWVDLHSEHIIWYALIYFLYSYEEKYRSQVTKKKY